MPPNHKNRRDGDRGRRARPAAAGPGRGGRKRRRLPPRHLPEMARARGARRAAAGAGAGLRGVVLDRPAGPERHVRSPIARSFPRLCICAISINANIHTSPDPPGYRGWTHTRAQALDRIGHSTRPKVNSVQPTDRRTPPRTHIQYRWDREAWIKGFETARTEEVYELDGAVPKDLDGTLFRNGHAKFDINVRLPVVLGVNWFDRRIARH